MSKKTEKTEDVVKTEETPKTEETKEKAAENAEETPKPEETPVEETGTEEAPKTEEVAKSNASEEIKGAVADIMQAMDREKYSRLQEVFKAIGAFDEAIWQADNTPEELNTLVAELVSILGTVEIKSVEETQDNTNQIDVLADALLAKSNQAFAEALKPLIETVTSLQGAVAEALKSAGSENENEPKREEKPEVQVEQATKEKSALTPSLALNEMLKTLKQNEEAIREMQKTAVAPQRSDDDPKLRKPEDEDPNACFGTILWPIG